MQGSGSHGANLVPLAEGVGRIGGGAGRADEGIGEGEYAGEATAGRAVARETSVEGGGGGKLLSPERRHCVVERAECEYGMSERHAWRLLGHWRGTQQYERIQRADEDELTAAVIALASQSGYISGFVRVVLISIWWPHRFISSAPSSNPAASPD